MGDVLVRIDVQDQAGPTPLDDVTVSVYASNGTTFVTEGTTGAPFAAGRVEFTLNGSAGGVQYVIRFSLDGWRFPDGAATISVTDPPSPDNDFGPYDAIEGPSDVLATLIVSSDETVPQPIEDVTVLIYDELDSFVAEATTDSSGEAIVPLSGSVDPGTTYIVRLVKDGVTFEDPLQTIAVIDPLVAPDTNVFDFTGHIVVMPESIDDDMCTVYGYFTDVSLLPARRLRFEFKPMPQFIETGRATVRGSSRLLAAFNSDPSIVRNKILTRSVQAETDTSGFVYVELPREGHFEVHIHGLEDPIDITERIYVPDLPSADLRDLLYPIVREVTFDTDPIAVNEGEAVTVGISVIMSSTEVITNEDLIDDLLEFGVADDSIAKVVLHGGEEISVSGLNAGSTTITVTRREEQVVPSRPAAPDLIVTPPVVTVS